MQLANGKKAHISRAEMGHLRRWGGGPGVVVLGFVGREWLRPYYHVTEGAYAFAPDAPNENGDSAAAASSLHRAMLDTKKIALCRFVRLSGVPARLMALIPHDAEHACGGAEHPRSGQATRPPPSPGRSGRCMRWWDRRQKSANRRCGGDFLSGDRGGYSDASALLEHAHGARHGLVRLQWRISRVRGWRERRPTRVAALAKVPRGDLRRCR